MLLQPALQAQLGDLSLLLGGFVQFGFGCVGEAVLLDGEHIGCGAAGGAQEEDTAKSLFIEVVVPGDLCAENVFTAEGGLLRTAPC